MQAPAGVSYPLNGIPTNRVSTLTPASVKFLDDIGAWPAIAPKRSAAFSQMQVWDSNGFVRYDAGLFPDPVMGYVAENNVIQQALMQKLEHSGRAIDKLWPVREVFALITADGTHKLRCLDVISCLCMVFAIKPICAVLWPQHVATSVPNLLTRCHAVMHTMLQYGKMLLKSETGTCACLVQSSCLYVDATSA